MRFSGEIQYNDSHGMVHSDMVNWNREMLHMALDEWLDRSNGTGGFYVGDCTFLPESFDDMRDLLANFRERRNNGNE